MAWIFAAAVADDDEEDAVAPDDDAESTVAAPPSLPVFVEVAAGMAVFLIRFTNNRSNTIISTCI